MKRKKLFIVSNRLPVKAKETSEGHFEFERSEGGLATGLNSLQTSYEQHWIGWPGVCLKRKADERKIKEELEKFNYHPVFLSATQYNNYYEGYSNSTIWPLCHYFYEFSKYRRGFWQAYQDVNRLFCKEVLKHIDDDSMIWVQDYQLMLLPGMLREGKASLKIGYFHHIPFPSYELFRVLPERRNLLRGLLGADFIAFHTHDYMRHFISAVERTLHLEFKLNEVMVDGRAVHVDALPMGINYELYHEAPKKRPVKDAIKRMKSQFGKHKIILSVDRLDYSKGILHRLVGFETFLEKHPEYQNKVTLAMIIVPSRDKVSSYAEMKRRIDERIGAINGKYAGIGWTPVCYYYHAFPFEDLVAMYKLADVALVTPLRDGMNLVAKEYVATKDNDLGVLILSEMAGASSELSDAIQINPNDTDQISMAICEALEMPEEEQKERLQNMQEIVGKQTVKKWAGDFVDAWKEVIERNETLMKKYISKEVSLDIKHKYNVSKHRLIMLDYDGTLAAFRRDPEKASPTTEVKNMLRKLCDDERNTVVINSGRDHRTLDKWLGDLPLSFAAEHGAFYKENGVWHENVEPQAWDERLMSILREFEDKTPNSRLEVKATAVAWHYRKVDNWIGMFRAQQLMHALIPICSQNNLQIMRGNKIVEVKPAEYSKGSEVQRILNQRSYDFILAIGDDVTDEDMFRALPEKAVTIKVGYACDDARYNLLEQKDVLPFLNNLLS
ncbi:bifunctional alpha,alpha-trehalose-phosphate synthase (UDP-forming)/trehalose-phosphatase [Hoylesella buccalis]|uniref:bifunctional alpha,alpha-trehalose-phosphate synthase (UDP-forming)/trehalose-phosphatase n=1 Tax=Hoylesella buccalis TaxID=28127 RepID=UPI00055CE2C5|nr:bifunctional alpha,alpha-trehalose-phosphate synthase (UDP-forming)/trehalose-phosphatase [Hoylesella buccalis]